MIGKQAIVLSSGSLKRLLAVAGRGRDRLIVLLSARAGLRACEIARLTWGTRRQLRLFDSDGMVTLRRDRCVPRRDGERHYKLRLSDVLVLRRYRRLPPMGEVFMV